MHILRAQACAKYKAPEDTHKRRVHRCTNKTAIHEGADTLRLPALHNAHNVRLLKNTADLPVNVQGVRSVEGHHLPSPSRSLEGVSAYHRGVRRRYLMPVCMCVHISSNSSLNTLPRDRLSSSVYKPNQVCPPCLRVGHRTSHTVSLAAFAF